MREIAHRRVELRLSGVAGDAAPQPSEHRIAPQRSIVELRRSRKQRRRHRRRRPQVEIEAEDRSLEPRRRDAHHRQQSIVHAQRSADDRRIGAEARLPVVVADDDDRFGAGPRDFVGAQETAERGA